MAALTLEIVEGPGAGSTAVVDRNVMIGRSDDAQLHLSDNQSSRRHAMVAPASDGSLVITDLESANGTFVNDNEVHGSARLDPGDVITVGVTVIEVRSRADVAARPSAVRAVPAGLAVAASEPAFVRHGLVADGVQAPLAPELDRYRDVTVRRRAALAPLALLILVVLAACVYFATR